MLSDDTIRRVKAASNIVQVFEHYGFSLKKEGKDYLTKCPFHRPDDKPSMRIHPREGYCKCFPCGGKGMDAIAFVREYLGLSFPEAIRELAAIFHIPIDEGEADGYGRSSGRAEPRPTSPPPEPKIEAPPSFIDPAIMRRTFARLSDNPLYAYCRRLFGEAAAREAFALYNVGTAKRKLNPRQGGNLSVVFWQVDEGGRVRGGKIMPYDPATGRRIKGGGAAAGWVHSALKMEGYNLRQCLFGQHLLAQPSERVNIVESEKTAILARLYFGERLGPWVATGGKGNEGLIAAALPLMEGRRLCVYPDTDAAADWRAKIVEPLSRLGVRVDVSTALSGESAADKLDLGDIIAAHMEGGGRGRRDEAEEQPATAAAEPTATPTAEAAAHQPPTSAALAKSAEREAAGWAGLAPLRSENPHWLLRGIYRERRPTAAQAEILDPAKEPEPCPF